MKNHIIYNDPVINLPEDVKIALKEIISAIQESSLYREKRKNV